MFVGINSKLSDTEECKSDMEDRIVHFPGGPVVKTLHFHCRGHRFDPWSGNYDPTCWVAWPKINK